MREQSRRWILALPLCLVAAGPVFGQDAGTEDAQLPPGTISVLDAATGQSSLTGEISPVRRVPPLPLRPLYSSGPIPLEAAPTTLAPQSADEFCCDQIHFLPTLGEVGILLVVPWYFNRHVSDDSTATQSFDAWKRNIVQGMEWDADAFKTNMFAHPYHGAMYFNAARANGYNFWQSAAWSWGGSFLWETFGENNRPAINDWTATAIGGIGLGESLNRLSRMIWDNSATGTGRTLRELGGFLVNPLGGFNRLVRGEWTKVGANPEGRFPKSSAGSLTLGFRSVGDAGKSEEQSGGFFAFDYRYGDGFKDYDKPFDSFRFYAQLNGSNEVQRIGQMHLLGTLYGTELKKTEKANHVFHLGQHFDYVNNRALETGGSSLSATFLSMWGLSERWSLFTRIEPSALLIWGVDSEYSDFTRRSYDFGSGAGLRARVNLLRDERQIVSVFYNLFWQHTLNGAVGDHVLQFLGANVRVPIFKRWEVGATGFYTARDSYYRDYPDVFRRFPEVRLFAGYSFE
jgi:hypothetical protein